MSKRQIRSFLSKERDRLIGYVRSRLHDANLDPEDVVQDVILKMLERTDSPAPEYLAAYTYRSLKNRLIDLARTRRDHVSLEDDSLYSILASKGTDVVAQIASEDGQAELFEALATLSEIERQVVIGHELEDQTFKSMAQRWEVPINTLLSHKSRAMKKLRIELTRRTK